MEETKQRRAVAVRKFPTELDATTEGIFLREAESWLQGRRPALVLDCTGARSLDRHGIWLMLRCLEEAMKRAGDVRLAGVATEARVVLEAAGLSRLFRIYETSADAIASFQQPLDYEVPPVYANGLQAQGARNAA